MGKFDLNSVVGVSDRRGKQLVDMLNKKIEKSESVTQVLRDVMSMKLKKEERDFLMIVFGMFMNDNNRKAEAQSLEEFSSPIEEDDDSS